MYPSASSNRFSISADHTMHHHSGAEPAGPAGSLAVLLPCGVASLALYLVLSRLGSLSASLPEYVAAHLGLFTREERLCFTNAENTTFHGTIVFKAPKSFAAKAAPTSPGCP